MRFWEQGGWWFPSGEQHLQQVITNPKRRHALDGRLTYQHHKYDAALPYVAMRRTAVDIGAHVGLWSWMMARDFARVVAFEPVAEHQECWLRNVADRGNAVLHLFALGDVPGQLRLARREANSSGSTCVKAEGGELAAVRTLDSFALADVDLIKIDVEGYELSVIRGAVETLTTCRPVVIVEQKGFEHAVFGGARDEAVTLLRALGMTPLRQPISGDWILGWPATAS